MSREKSIWLKTLTEVEIIPIYKISCKTMVSNYGQISMNRNDNSYKNISSVHTKQGALVNWYEKGRGRNLIRKQGTLQRRKKAWWDRVNEKRRAMKVVTKKDALHESSGKE